MEKLTREDAIQKHREMWNWIAEQINETEEVQDIEQLKNDYVGGLEDAPPMHDCFLCEYMGDRVLENCGGICILVWAYEGGCLRAEYTECKNAKTWEEQHKLALQIANLEEREVSSCT